MPDDKSSLPPGTPVSTVSNPGQPGQGTPTPAREKTGGPGQDSDASAEWPSIPGYEILGELGRGGMGIVYKARQTEPSRVVALKVIRKERLAHPEPVRRFRREAQAAARLAHPNIVAVHDFDQAGDTHYLAMEFVEGVTMQRLVEQAGPLPPSQACDFVRQAALGLQHAHEQALVHRDVKPSNLMIALPAGQPVEGKITLPPGAVVKVLDMGVARLHQMSGQPEDSLTTLTQDGAVIGTPDYVAPEQLEDAHTADIRADLYSLGCTFYYLLTGQVPFPGGHLLQKLDRQRWEMPPPVEQLRAEVPGAVGEVVRRLMAKRPADRYQTPAELAAALEALARTGRVPAVPRPDPVRSARRLEGHADSVWCAAFSPDGRWIASGSKDRTVRLWDVAGAKETRRFADHSQDVASVAFVPAGQHLVVASGIAVRVLDVQTGKQVARFTGHTNAVKAVAVSPDGRRILSGGDDRTVRYWEVQNGRELRRLAKHTSGVTSVAFVPEGRQAVSGGRDQALRLWNVQDGQEVPRFPVQKGQVLSVAISPDGRHVLSGSFDTTLRLWDLTSGRELRRFQGHTRMVAAVAFSPDGRRILSGSHDHSVRLWDLESASELCCFQGHAGPVTCVAFAPDGRTAVSGGMDKTICLWQVPE